MTATSIILPRNWWLMAMAAGLAALLLVVRSPSATERPVTPLFPGFDGAEITELRIETPMDEGAEPEVVTLVRESVDDPWKVQELYGAPGNANRIGSVLNWVGTMTDLDVVSRGATPVTDYGLGEGEAVKVTLRRGHTSPGEGPGLDGDALSLFASPGSGGGAFVRLAGEKRVARVPQFPLQARGPLSWFERDSLVPLESIQIRKVVVTGSALAEPLTVTLPDRVMTEFVDGSGTKIPTAVALELFRSLRATFPDDVIALPDEGLPAVLEWEITPAVGTPFRVVFTDLGESAATGAGRPGKGFRLGSDYGVVVNPLALSNVMKALEAVRNSVK